MPTPHHPQTPPPAQPAPAPSSSEAQTQALLLSLSDLSSLASRAAEAEAMLASWMSSHADSTPTPPIQEINQAVQSLHRLVAIRKTLLALASAPPPTPPPPKETPEEIDAQLRLVLQSLGFDQDEDKAKDEKNDSWSDLQDQEDPDDFDDPDNLEDPDDFVDLEEIAEPDADRLERSQARWPAPNCTNHAAAIPPRPSRASGVANAVPVCPMIPALSPAAISRVTASVANLMPHAQQPDPASSVVTPPSSPPPPPSHQNMINSPGSGLVHAPETSVSPP